MPHNENSRVKIPALVHFTRLGYTYLSLKKYTGSDLIDEDTNIFVDLLCAAINRINGTEYTIEDVDDYLFDGNFILVAEDGNNLKALKEPITTWASGKFWVNNHAHILGEKMGIA